ncbi:restriction endonuclease [Streptomyces sp. NPDC087297]|uniref:restriction endonuclease n=1 Tax=Streptomyces sp. NPDC087297 TaxID=3365778 RepID=UPI00382D71BB
MASTSRRPRPARRHPAARGHRPALRVHLLRQLSPADRGILAGVAIVALVAGGHYLSRHPAVLAALLVLLGLAGTMTACLWGRGQYRHWRRAGHGALPTGLDEWRTLSPGGLERVVARLCRRDGCTRVRVLRSSGSEGAGDVRARTPDGRWLLVQCKTYGSGTKVTADTLYQVNNSYQDTYGCDLAAVVTTNTFTPDAVDWNCDLPVPIALFGSRQLLDWALREGPAPWE